MFGSSRRHRAPVQPLTKETANPNAATAAASAFMRREPSATLSSAAAAAALKARPITPTNVAEAPSKRAHRRSASVTSTRSQDRGAAGGKNVRRSPSASSMTERTFRSPSPGRNPAPPGHDVPPVPSLPKQQVQRPRSAYAAPTHIQTQPFATASQKLKSGQQGSWFGAAKAGDDNNVRTSDSVLQTAATTSAVSEPRPGSISPINSINFSYPRALHESPSPSSAHASEVVMVYDANSRRMVPKVEMIDLMEQQQSVRLASEKPVKKKKQSVARSGLHLAKGTVNRTIAAPVEPSQPVPPTTEAAQTIPLPRPEVSEAQQLVTQSPPPAIKPVPPPREEEEVESPIDRNDGSHFVMDQTPEPNATVRDSPVAEMPVLETSVLPALNKKPSTVLEEPEVEKSSNASQSISSKDYAAINTTPVRYSQPKPSPSPEPSYSHQEHPSARDSVQRTRMHSESPARSPGRAHFAAAATDQLVVRHEPPPRSLSPRKSALKQSSSIRDASPSDDSSEASASLSAISRDDSAQARKKAVRVSFNEDYNVVLGESAEPQENDSPVVLSPQSKHKPWRSFLNRNKKDGNSFDEDETMTPRPTLPLFGSVREKKAKEPDNERPLVRPTERPNSPPAQASPGTSADSALGSILAQESASRNAANISKTREPLPPVVQSIEGNGYMSSSNESSDEEPDDFDTQRSSQTAQSTPIIGTDVSSQDMTSQPEAVPEFVETQQYEKVISTSPPPGAHSFTTNNSHLPHVPSLPIAALKPDETPEIKDNYIPSISVQRATPPARAHVPDSPDREYFDVPGGFPSDHGPSASSGEESVKELGKSVEPVPLVVESAPSSPTRVDMAMDDIAEEESEHSSIYSDAYEDLSDVGMDGFMSLDAVLEAPPKSQMSRLYEKTVNESKAHALANGTAQSSSFHPPPLKTPDDWDSAKAYWRSLTVDKRRQLEKEAIEEAAEEADQEAVSKPKKTKKRRSVDRQSSSPKTTEPAPNPERVYQIQAGSTWTPDESQIQSKNSSPPPAQTSPAKEFRKSMRAEQPSRIDTAQPASGAMRKTLRSNGTSGGAQVSTSMSAHKTTAARPASYHVGTAVEPPKSSRRTLSSEGQPASSSGFPSANVKPTLRRRGSDSSESSFRRSRSNISEAGFGFRRSMRSQSQEPESPKATTGSGRFSIRSLSPTGTRTPFRRSTPAPVAPTMGMGGGQMRSSLRAAPEPKDKGRFSSFGRSSGKKVKKGLGASRFADSSDEDDGRPALSSRFADSSDEDGGYQPPPSRNGGLAAKSMRSSKGPSPAATGGAPLGRQVRSDSPDLPDSDDDASRAVPGGSVNGNARPELPRSRSGRGSLTSVSPAVVSTQGVGERPTHQRRGSFISSILRRKKDSGGKISRDIGESAARRDTKLERGTGELGLIRSNSGGRPRLQKRGPSWPLPDEADDDQRAAAPSSPMVEPQRPATASGGPSATAPRGFLARRSLSAQQVPPVPAIPKNQLSDMPPETSSQMTELPRDASLKKKKFGTLRKMFGLND